MEIFNCDQGSEEWFRLRAGIPTASEFATVLASGKGGGESKTRRTYLMRLAGEIITGEPAESYTNVHMERGKTMEEEARNYYAFVSDEPLSRVGFVRNGQKGCSPDSLVGDRGMLEIKTALPHILIDLILKDEFPPAHKAQCQGALWIAEREYIDISVYWPKMPSFVKRANRDELYIQRLATEIDTFNNELAELVERIKRYGRAEAA
jgi:hypothetical protein